MESILDSVKKLLGIDKDYDHFDTDLIVHINTAFFTLMQLGVGPEGGFTIKDNSKKWGEFLTDKTDLEAVKSYVYLKVRVLFDPPGTSSILESMNKMIQEYEWRLNVQVESTLIPPE